MKYLITGAAGMLGRDLRAALAASDVTARNVTARNVTALSRFDLDITDLDAVREAVAGHDVVVNAAAYTKVDEAETHEAEAHAVNAIGAGNLALATSDINARLVQLSTDYVFDGNARDAYAEDTALNPISAYGRTKADGERFTAAANPAGTYIVRTAWLYGEHGPNFAKTMLKLAATHDTVSVVDDQFGQPTWTADLAAQIVKLLNSNAPPGVYHGTNSGRTSWYDLARETFRLAGLDPDRVTRTNSSQFVRAAPRPSFSVLGHAAWHSAGLEPMRGWETALADATDHGVFGAA